MREVKYTKNLQEIAFADALPMIQKYVHYFYRSGKFYSLAKTHDEDDLFQDVCLKWLENGYLKKFCPEVTSVPYFIMVGVRNYFIDTLRKQRLTVSLDSQDDDGFSLADVIPDDIDHIEMMMEADRLEELLEELPDETNSKIIVISPIGEHKATLRFLARLLLEGYSQAECRKFFLNPRSMKPVTSGRISQMVNEIKDIYRMCGLC